MPGLKIPLRATSIIPVENIVPNKIPTAATVMITLKEATLEPIAEFKKLTASFVTPTIKSEPANRNKITTMTK